MTISLFLELVAGSSDEEGAEESSEAATAKPRLAARNERVDSNAARAEAEAANLDMVWRRSSSSRTGSW
jgi:hypothetical protein